MYFWNIKAFSDFLVDTKYQYEPETEHDMGPLKNVSYLLTRGIVKRRSSRRDHTVSKVLLMIIVDALNGW